MQEWVRADPPCLRPSLQELVPWCPASPLFALWFPASVALLWGHVPAGLLPGWLPDPPLPSCGQKQASFPRTWLPSAGRTVPEHLVLLYLCSSPRRRSLHVTKSWRQCHLLIKPPWVSPRPPWNSGHYLVVSVAHLQSSVLLAADPTTPCKPWAVLVHPGPQDPTQYPAEY